MTSDDPQQRAVTPDTIAFRDQMTATLRDTYEHQHVDIHDINIKRAIYLTAIVLSAAHESHTDDFRDTRHAIMLLLDTNKT